MQKAWYDEETKRQLRARFNSHDRLIGKGEYRFPVTAEREYIRLTNWYMKQVRAVLEEELPKLSEQYKQEYADYKAVHQDGLFDFPEFAGRFFDGIKEKIQKSKITETLTEKLHKIAGITKNVEVREFKNMIKRTLGMEVAEDYYTQEFFADTVQSWVSANVDLITTVPNDMLGKMKELVLEAYTNGTTPTDLADQIQAAYGMSKGHANMIASDQMSKLSAQMLRKEHEDAGITKYKWQTMEDDRVRDGHRVLNGNIYSYDNPPDVGDGRHLNPGEDYNCRCQAIPVVEEATLNIPLASAAESMSKLAAGG